MQQKDHIEKRAISCETQTLDADNGDDAVPAAPPVPRLEEGHGAVPAAPPAPPAPPLPGIKGPEATPSKDSGPHRLPFGSADLRAVRLRRRPEGSSADAPNDKTDSLADQENRPEEGSAANVCVSETKSVIWNMEIKPDDLLAVKLKPIPGREQRQRPLQYESDPDDAFSLLRAELAKRSQILHSPAETADVGTVNILTRSLIYRVPSRPRTSLKWKWRPTGRGTERERESLSALCDCLRMKSRSPVPMPFTLSCNDRVFLGLLLYLVLVTMLSWNRTESCAVYMQVYLCVSYVIVMVSRLLSARYDNDDVETDCTAQVCEIIHTFVILPVFAAWTISGTIWVIHYYACLAHSTSNSVIMIWVLFSYVYLLVKFYDVYRECRVMDDDVDDGFDLVLRSHPAPRFDPQQMPTFTFGDDTTKTDDSDCCAICLDDFVAGDLCKDMPNCGHCFHAACVDRWLPAHPSCPVCRTTVNQVAWDAV
ncbi:unnamed protein product (mitochondrion) [Plasmodiophora brassicae]|uniref:RING-type domain-containing protein n=1 Tax=Plasmodiophora brassicae TaxID=37360 RepID=A0A3P3YEE1_PLABS|nr:unnamed protein product [Plasmodiophora brassicae]